MKTLIERLEKKANIYVSEATGKETTALEGRAMFIIEKLRADKQKKLADELYKMTSANTLQFELNTGGQKAHVAKLKGLAQKIKGAMGAQVLAIADDFARLSMF